ncbi:MAG: HPP family protein [Planctomycetes bacterium]|nr:HPP family protein [Planctomycetota bacterium]
MNRSLEKMLEEFRQHWKNYILQSGLATLVFFVLLFVLDAADVLIVASLGSTAFVVFAMPKSLTAQPRNVVGGQMMGLASGALCTLAGAAGGENLVLQYSLYSFAVGLSLFLMVVTDTEHPPASGTALGVAMQGVKAKTTLVVVVGAILLALVHHLLRGYLRDLA